MKSLDPHAWSQCRCAIAGSQPKSIAKGVNDAPEAQLDLMIMMVLHLNTTMSDANIASFFVHKRVQERLMVLAKSSHRVRMRWKRFRLKACLTQQPSSDHNQAHEPHVESQYTKEDIIRNITPCWAHATLISLVMVSLRNKGIAIGSFADGQIDMDRYEM